MWDEVGFRTNLEVVAPLNTLLPHPWVLPHQRSKAWRPHHITEGLGCRTVATANHLSKSVNNMENLNICNSAWLMHTRTSHSRLYFQALCAIFTPHRNTAKGSARGNWDRGLTPL